LGYKEEDVGGDCTICGDKCPCYCNALCQVRPPSKRIAAEWIVSPPRYRKNPERLIPRLIHQTWFEVVSPEKYPNMSRLIESFRKSGWEYEFYDDDRAAKFLSAHFPSAVREAYDSLIPGAFKADLFRYCVLLIRGGLYADMDILLESNLDESIPPDVGFLTAQDSPGEKIGHRSCLWNGLMAVAPAHPVLAQTIQTVVNNIRNRYTSVDYDDMLCPNPVLSVSHTVDTLFTCGPCILGASLNDVLRRHRQTGFDYGEIDIFATEKNEVISNSAAYASSDYLSLIEPDDPRWLIPGKTILLKQNKADMGSHRFTATDKNLIVAVTDMPEYDDRPKSIQHYSKSHVKFGVYGLSKLYHDQNRANEEVLIRIDGSNPLLRVENTNNLMAGTSQFLSSS
jgi:Glycosyltransferase sugar-binding region containing DXD motif